MPSGVNAPSGTADSVSSSVSELSEEAPVSSWEAEGVSAAWLLSELPEALFDEGEGAGVWLSEEASVSAWEVEGVWAAWLLSELPEALFDEGEGAGVWEGAACVSPPEDWGAAEEAAWVCAGSL